MKTMLLLCGMLLTPMPSWAQETLADLQNARRAYPTPMSPAQISDMLNRVAKGHPGWGMLRKDGGFKCPTPNPNVSISCDYMVHGPTGWAYDMLQDADGAAVPKGDAGSALAPGQEIVFPWTVDTPGPTPTPVPPIGAPLTKLDLQILEDNVVQRTQNMFSDVQQTLERMFGCRDGKTPQGENCATAQDNADAIRGISKQVKDHDEKTNKLLAFFSDGKTVSAIIAAVTTYLTIGRKGN